MNKGCHRPLRPAAVAAVSPSSQGVGVKPKLRSKVVHKTKAACHFCRMRKSACDGRRPVCSTCHRRENECVYSTDDPSQTRSMALKQKYEALKAELDELHGLLDSIRLSPEHVAQDIFRRIRSSPNVPAVLQHVRTHSDKELGLLARPPAAYPMLDPADDQILLEGLRKVSVDDGSLHVAAPEPAAKYCDPRLARLKITFWSAVPVTDEYAAGAISFYLETDHATYGLFDADLFVGDLVSGQPRYCSAFLVNCLLAFASHAYTSRDPAASGKSDEFEKAAEMLWSVEKDVDSITAVAGLLLLYSSNGCQGQAEKGSMYINEASRMAKNLGLFGVRDRLGLQEMPGYTREDLQAMAHTAWGAFGCIAMQSILYIVEPPEYPPTLPIPGRLADRPPEGNPPLHTQSILSPELHQNFVSLSTLWTIASKALSLYHHRDGPDAVPPAFALSIYEELLTLADSLPMSMKSAEDNLPQTTSFHIFYHIIILDVFRPFLSTKPTYDRTVWALASLSPDTIFRASVAQLKRLVLRYRSRLLATCFSILWNIGLLALANAILMDVGEHPDWRLYFSLCIGGYRDMFPTFRVSESIAQSLLMMAIDYGAISELDAQKKIQEFCNRVERSTAALEPTRGFVVDLDLATTDRDAAAVDNLVTRFEETMAVAEFINMNELYFATEG